MRLATGRKASSDSIRPIDSRLADTPLRVPVAIRPVPPSDRTVGDLVGAGSLPARFAMGERVLPRGAARLDIERPFGIMQGKEARVTKHDAERKVRILDFIAATLRARGYPPSVRESAVAVGLASTSAVHHHLQILEREGYLERGAAQSRAIRLTPTAAMRLGLSSELVPQATSADSRV